MKHNHIIVDDHSAITSSNLYDHLDINEKTKEYISSSGEHFDYRFRRYETYAVLLIDNERTKEHWKFFVAIDPGINALTISQYDENIFHQSAQTYLPVIELLIDIVGGSCCIMYLEKHDLSFDTYHITFVKVNATPILPRGNLNKQLVQLKLGQ